MFSLPLLVRPMFTPVSHQVELCKVKKRDEIQAHEAEIRRGKMAKRRRLLQQQEDTGQDVVTATQVDTTLDDIEINALPEKSCAVQICTGEIVLKVVM